MCLARNTRRKQKKKKQANAPKIILSRGTKTIEKKENGQFITFYELEGEGKSQEIEKGPNLISHFCKEVKVLLKSNKSKVKKIEKKMNLNNYKVRSLNLFKS